MKFRPRRRESPIELVRADWDDTLRITTSREPGLIVIAVQNATPGAWVETAIATGDVDDIVRLLHDAREEAEKESSRYRDGRLP